MRGKKKKERKKKPYYLVHYRIFSRTSQLKERYWVTSVSACGKEKFVLVAHMHLEYCLFVLEKCLTFLLSFQKH